MKRRILSVILTLCLLAGLSPPGAWAAGVADADALSGTCGDNLTWTLANGALTISGSGKMTDYSSASDVPWYNYRSDITTVVMESGVTAIGKYAFHSCEALKDVTIPDSVASIGYGAFLSCSGLKSVTIPDSVTSIGVSAFAGCGGLTEVTIPDSVTSIGISAFSSCSGLKSMTIPDSVTSISSSLFRGCSGLTSVTIPNSVTAIGDMAFDGCSALTGVTIPDSVTSIGALVFRSCGALTSVAIPASVTKIGTQAFTDCSVLADVYYGGTEAQWATLQNAIGNGNDPLLNAAIHYNGSGGSDGETVTLDRVSLSASTVTLDGLGDETVTATALDADGSPITTGVAWSVTPSGSGVEIADETSGVVAIAANATAGDYAVTATYNGVSRSATLRVAKTAYAVTYDPNGGSGTMGAESVNSDETLRATLQLPANGFTPPTGMAFRAWSVNGAEYAPGATVTIEADTVVTALWETASVTITFAPNGGSGTMDPVVPSETTYTLPQCGFTPPNNAVFRTWLVQGNAVNGSESYEMAPGNLIDLTGHASVTLTAQWTVTGYAISFAPNGGSGTMDAVTVEPGAEYALPANGFTAPDGMAFRAWSVNGEEYAPYATLTVNADTVVTAQWAAAVDDNILASGYCGGEGDGTNLSWVLTRDGVLTISGSGAMADYSSIDGERAPWYDYRASITTAIMESGVTTIGTYAFYNCNAVTSVTIPDSVTSIGTAAFWNCSGLTSVTIPNSVTSIGTEAFRECSKLMSVTIPNSVTSIGTRVFMSCFGLTSVTIPNHFTFIAEGTFQYCSGLTNITIPNSVTSIGFYAFQDCSRLTSLTIPDSVTFIGQSAFWGCSGLTNLTIPDSVTFIGEDAFVGCSGLTNLAIPNSVTSIGRGAFWGCSGLTSVTIPNSVTSIGSNTFLSCSGLTSVTIPNSVISIGYSAFSGCGALQSVTIPVGVTGIPEYVFLDCDSLTDVYYGGTRAQWNAVSVNDEEYGNVALHSATIHCTDGDIVNGVTTYTVTFVANGGSGVMQPVSVTAGATYALPANGFTAPQNMRFRAWSVNNAEYAPGAALTVNADTVVTALWEEIPVATYNVTFAPNGGSGVMQPVSVTAGATYALPANGFTPPQNMRFRAWSVNGAEYAPGATVTVNADTVVTALWEEIPVATHNVTFAPNGGSGVMQPVSVTAGATYALPANGFTAPRNMRFRAWSVNNAEYAPGVAITVNADMTVTALWEEIPVATYAITFNANGGSGVMQPVSVTAGATYALPANGFTAPQNMTFRAWSVNGVEYAPGVVITISADTVVTALWATATVTLASVTLSPSLVTVDGTHGATATATAIGSDGAPITSGVSWSIRTPANGDATLLSETINLVGIDRRITISDAGTITIGSNATAGNYTVTATYNGVSRSSTLTVARSAYAVTFDANGGSGVMQSVSVAAGATYALPANGFTAPQNMTFRAWSVNNVEYAPGAAIAVSGDITVTAQWKEAPDAALDPYRVLEAIHDMDTFEDQTWHLAGPLSEFRNLFFDRDPDEPSSATPLTLNVDYTAEEGSTKLNIPAETFAQFGEGTHSVEAEFQTSPDPNVYKDDGTRTATGYYTVRPSGKVTIDASEINAAKAVRGVSLTARFYANPRLNNDYYRFIVTDGEIPAGLTFHESGYFRGVIAESAEASYTFTLGLQFRKYAADPWPDDYSDTLQVTISVEPNTATNVEQSSDPGYELVERIPAVIEEGGGTLHLVSKGSYEEFQDFYIDGVKQIRGVDYQVRPCEIDPATGQMIRLLDGGAITGTYLSLLASKLSAGTHDLNLEYVGKDNIGNPKPRNASQKVTVTPKTTSSVTPVSSGGSSGGGSSSGGSSSPVAYAIKTGSAVNGKLSLSASKIAAGKTVTVTVTPNSGYQTGSVSVIDSKKNSVTVKRDGNQYTFTMPKRAVTVSATFTPVSYGVSAASAQHGKITLDKSSATRGATVNGSTTPDKGYLLSGVTVRDANGASVKTETFDNGKFTFLMPLGNVTVSATFTVKRLASFVDIQGPDWFFDDAEWAYHRGILQGMNAQYWEPQSLMSSVTSIVTLERLDGVDLTPYDTGADDGLDNSAWYVSAWRWARDNDILLKDRPFGEREAMTRGEFAVMLTNYLRYRGMSVTPTNEAIFADAAQMTQDELTAFRFLQDADVFRGYSDGTIRPNAYLSRAHLSALLHRLSAYIIQAETDGV